MEIYLKLKDGGILHVMGGAVIERDGVFFPVNIDELRIGLEKTADLIVSSKSFELMLKDNND